MKVTLTRNQVQEMLICLQTTLEGGVNLPYKWKYALSKNIDKLESEAKTIQKLMTPKPIFSKYNKERMKLAELHSEKDANGKPVMLDTIPPQYKITKNRVQFDKEIAELEARPEYKECLAERDKLNSPEFQNEVMDYELHEIRVKKEEQDQLENGKIIIPGQSFRFTMKIMVNDPDLKVV